MDKSSYSKCYITGCQQQPKHHLTQISNGESGQEHYTCRVHLQELISEWLHPTEQFAPAGKCLEGATECYVTIAMSNRSPRRGTVFLKAFDGGGWTTVECKHHDLLSLLILCRKADSSELQVHDVLRSLIEALGANLCHVVIRDSDDDEEVVGDIVISAAHGESAILCRPCDAICTAFRGHVPIFVSNRLLRGYSDFEGVAEV